MGYNNVKVAGVVGVGDADDQMTESEAVPIRRK